jgi:hypothetical protein
MDTCCLVYKHFTPVTYSPSKISCAVHCMHAPMQCFQNVLAYFASVRSYADKMFMKLRPGCGEGRVAPAFKMKK